MTINPRDPQQIVFTRYAYDTTGQLAESLNWLDIRVRAAIPLAPADQAMRQAAFSPDGQELAFVQREGASENLFVASLVVANGQPQLNDAHQVVSGVIAQPAWRPDGFALAYLELSHGRYQLWSVERGQPGNSDFGKPRQLTSGAELDATSRPIWLSGTAASTARQWFEREAQ